MLTKVETFSVRQRVLHTIDDQLPRSEPEIADRLRRIANREMLKYVQNAWKTGAPITPQMWSGYTRRQNWLGYAAIRAMAIVPMPPGGRNLARHLKSRLARYKKRLIPQG